ncbi:MAG TPA: 3-phosphoserine/phosphohydroxythreonine transaminase [Polyangiaceae bacterium]|nr:3-phosphoserine/phosphohydroxythreonine transaminase [Polyangiaceae bacterium]
MAKRVHNFNPGPATLPLAVLEQARDELVDYRGTGMSILEHSHRGKAYEAVHHETLARLRALLGVPGDYAVLLVQGGAHQQFAMAPMNLLPPGGHAAYVVTGRWGERAIAEARTVGEARLAASTEAGGQYARVARDDEADVDPGAAYLHYTSNETIDGVQYQRVPAAPAGVPLVCDMSSDFLSRPVDVARFGLIYAGAQKNAGPSGVTIVIVKNDLVARARQDLPQVFRYATHAAHDSLYHTAPTFNVYVVCLVLRWLEQKGGLGAIEAESRRKAGAIYEAIDDSPEVFRAPVERESRSRVNVVFRLPTPELEAKFLAGAEAREMVGLRGHRSVGGVRVSLYNALAPESAELLAEYMRAFARSA